MDDSWIIQIRRSLLESVGVGPNEETETKLVYIVEVEEWSSITTTEVRLIKLTDPMEARIEVWYSENSRPFIEVARFQNIIDIESVSSFIQQFAMLQ